VSPLLTVKDLRVRIGGSHILQGVTFDVPATGITVLLGRNGVGKSTTIKAVLGLTPATAQVDGDVTFDGDRVTGVATHRLVRSGLGYVPEDRGVFSGLTVAENLRLAERSDEPAYDLGVRAVSRPGPPRKAAGRTLSGGQQQMVALARVLLNRNRLLLVDEPTKGLAPKVVTEVADVLERVATTVPVLLVEQNLAVVRRLGRDAVVLAAGQVAYTGTINELLDDAELTRALLGVGHRHSVGQA
jgi:branched-chain amino acid transport system ATP-binding protein